MIHRETVGQQTSATDFCSISAPQVIFAVFFQTTTKQVWHKYVNRTQWCKFLAL